jgi:predicted dehydrogenase
MIGIGVVGYGYWGPNLARNFAAAGARIVAVGDRRRDRLELARRRYPRAMLTAHWRDLVRNPGVDAVVIATPPAMHFEIANDSLSADKHVLLEKPLSASSEQACRLIESAARRRLTLMVDHTFVHAGSIRSIHRMVADGMLGKLRYYSSARVGLPPACRHVNVLWDLAVHDIAILDHLIGRVPTAIAATGACASPGSSIDNACLTLHFGEDFVAHVHASWLSPVKIRRTLLGGERRTVVYDDLEPIEKVKVYGDPGAAGDDGPPDRRRAGNDAQTIWIPRFDPREPLALVAGQFLDCVIAGRRPLTDGEAGLRAVRVLEIATASMAQGGRLLRGPDERPI